MFNLLIRVALVARYAANFGAHPESITDGAHVVAHARVIGGQHIKGEQRVCRRIQGEVKTIGTIVGGDGGAREQSALWIPHMFQHGQAHAIRGLAEIGGAIMGAHVL